MRTTKNNLRDVEGQQEHHLHFFPKENANANEPG